jgi:hypothetical protein
MAGKITAYFADRSILVSLIKDSKAPGKLKSAENYLSIEPYALALPRGDEEFRLAVDRALSHIYRGGETGTLFKRTFGDANPGEVLGTLYLITGLPELCSKLRAAPLLPASSAPLAGAPSREAIVLVKFSGEKVRAVWCAHVMPAEGWTFVSMRHSPFPDDGDSFLRKIRPKGR